MCCGIGQRHAACPATSDVILNQKNRGLPEVSFARWTLVGQTQMRSQCRPTPPVGCDVGGIDDLLRRRESTVCGQVVQRDCFLSLLPPSTPRTIGTDLGPACRRQFPRFASQALTHSRIRLVQSRKPYSSVGASSPAHLTSTATTPPYTSTTAHL